VSITAQAKEIFTPTKTIGINGLERASAALRLQNDAVLQSSFNDLEQLMARAKDLIALAEQLASKLSTAPSSSASDARVALRESTELLGLNTPIVTKEIAGGEEAYWAELARQVAEFLTSVDRGSGESILRREGGVLPLIDLFAIYNRARGVGKYSFPALLEMVLTVSTGESDGSCKCMCHVSQTPSSCASEDIQVWSHRGNGLVLDGRSHRTELTTVYRLNR